MGELTWFSALKIFGLILLFGAGAFAASVVLDSYGMSEPSGSLLLISFFLLFLAFTGAAQCMLNLVLGRVSMKIWLIISGVAILLSFVLE
ncbi:hypothetical protein [Agrobacterium larrymoorei]|uniref:Uncharacterized protein n=1 Tax=Agrobacterium larrymoorei TaxID=160699 RepID=A0AAF0KDY9_9HYPH|nr:hypothetical protein [Agrobacterium larrymoorei]WHA40437.1 hypothetical protein CFBP5477_011430 [Agrobacterium larrymoorei]